MSRSLTLSAPLCASISTSPKNWKPARGELFAVGGAFWNTTSGPKVPSSGLGPKLPAFKGPATNSQNGSNCWKAARLGW